MSVHMPKFDHEAYYDQFDAVGAMELQQTPEHPTSAPLSQEARVPPTCLPQFHLPTRTRRLLLPLPPLAVESSLVLHQVLSLSPTLPLSLSPSLSPSLSLSAESQTRVLLWGVLMWGRLASRALPPFLTIPRCDLSSS